MAKESLTSKQERSKNIIKVLKKTYPNSKCSLHFESPFQLLIATILSAQCTDDRVNQTTPALFKKYPDAKGFLAATQAEVETLIRSTGFYKNKAKNILACCQQIVEKYPRGLPKTTEELHALPGVGRKTANVVLGTAFGIPGMVVDTHVTRITNRLGFCKGTDAVKLEMELMKIVEKEDWVKFTHLLIDHGRAVCVARTPKCEDCVIKKFCPQKPYIK
ncbi:MAG: endonuclease III [Bdellovibrionales bacterium]|nr:endonuclease III [Bdellovibrionales bacterium]